MIKTMTIPTMLLLAVSGTASVPSVAQPLKTALKPVKTLDIAGIRPGMKPVDAVALLQRTGWTVNADPGNSWLEVVEEAVARRRNEIPPTSAQSGVYNYNAAKGEETVRVNIVPTPDGGRVGLVQYRAPQAGRSHEQIRAEVIARYGPSIYGPRQRVLIAPQGKLGEMMSLEVDSTGMRLTLSPSSAADREARALVDRAVTGRLGAVGTSF